MAGADWDVHYQSGSPPWETGRPSDELQRFIAELKMPPCRVIELGCGSGINAIWLAQQGFDVTGVDFSPLAIEKAKRRAADANAAVRFILGDVLDLPEKFEPFPFFFDRGCYHAVRRNDVQAYLRTLREVTAPGSLGLILTGNARDPHEPGQGPPVVSAEEIHAELGTVFEIVRLHEFYFDQNEGDGRRFLAWACMLRRQSACDPAQ
jgi:SAM-dependent methyltransferase